MKRILLALILCVIASGSHVAEAAVPPLTIYTMGDIDTYFAALNGVAMLFDDTGVTATESGLVSQKASGVRTFGPIMGIGLLVSLLFVAISGIMRQELRLDQLLVSVILAYALFIPRTTVLLEDIYSGQVKSVANIPYGVAMPSALISTFTYTFSQRLEQAFSLPSSPMGTMPLISGGVPSGFVDPLKVLMTMRNMNICESNKGICDSMFEYMRYCLADSSGNRLDMNAVMASADPVSLLFISTGINALTFYRSDYPPVGGAYTFSAAALKEGVTLNCSDAGNAIYADANTYRSNVGAVNSFANDFAYAMKERKLGSGIAGGGASATAGVESRARLSNSIAGFQAAGMLTDQKASELALQLRQPAIAAMMAAAEPNRALAYNVFLTTAMHQYQVDAAADGTMFLKTMLPSMSILTFFFFAFSPIVAMLVMMTGMQSIKIVLSYLTFGLWTQSWMPGAVIVNYFVQLQLLGQLGSNGGITKDAFLSWAHQPDFFEVLATNLAVSANMLASVPVVMMALISGSAYGLSQLAGAVGASRKGYFDEKAVAPDFGTATNAAPWMKTAGDAGAAPAHGGMGDGPNMAISSAQASRMGNFSIGAEASQVQTALASTSAAAQRAHTQTTGQMASSINSYGEGYNSNHAIGMGTVNSMTNSAAAMRGQDWSTGDGVKYGSNYQTATRVAAEAGLAAAADTRADGANMSGTEKAEAAAGRYKNQFKQTMGGLLRAGLIGKITETQSDDLSHHAANEASSAFKSSFTNSDGLQTAKVKKASDESKVARDKHFKSDQQFGTNFQDMMSASQTITNNDTLSKAITDGLKGGGGGDITGAQLASNAASGNTEEKSGGGVRNALDFAEKRANGHGASAQAFVKGLGQSFATGGVKGFVEALHDGMMSSDAKVAGMAAQTLANWGSNALTQENQPLLSKGQADVLNAVGESKLGKQDRDAGVSNQTGRSDLSGGQPAIPAGSPPISTADATGAAVTGGIASAHAAVGAGGSGVKGAYAAMPGANSAEVAKWDAALAKSKDSNQASGQAAAAAVGEAAQKYMNDNGNIASFVAQHLPEIMGAPGGATALFLKNLGAPKGGLPAPTGGGPTPASPLPKGAPWGGPPIGAPSGNAPISPKGGAPWGGPPIGSGGPPIPPSTAPVSRVAAAMEAASEVGGKAATLAGKGLGIAGLAAEAGFAARDVAYANAHGRPDLAESRMSQSAYRTAAGFAGGAAVGLLTAPTGPGAVAGALVGSVAGHVVGNWAYTKVYRDAEAEIAALRALNGDGGIMDGFSEKGEEQRIKRAQAGAAASP